MGLVIPIPIFIPGVDGRLPLWVGVGLIGLIFASLAALFCYWWLNP